MEKGFQNPTPFLQNVKKNQIFKKDLNIYKIFIDILDRLLDRLF